MTTQNLLGKLSEALNYNPDDGIFTRKISYGKYRVGDIAGTIDWHGYNVISVRIDGIVKHFQGHRLAWLFMTGSMPDKWIDHIDGNGANNAWSNLRLSTRTQNQHNRGKNTNNTSGFKGVYKKRNKWAAEIISNGVKMRLGVFDCPAAAHFSYQVAAAIHHGEFARAA